MRDFLYFSEVVDNPTGAEPHSILSMIWICAAFLEHWGCKICPKGLVQKSKSFGTKKRTVLSESRTRDLRISLSRSGSHLKDMRPTL